MGNASRAQVVFLTDLVRKVRGKHGVTELVRRYGDARVLRGMSSEEADGAIRELKRALAAPVSQGASKDVAKPRGEQLEISDEQDAINKRALARAQALLFGGGEG